VVVAGVVASGLLWAHSAVVQGLTRSGLSAFHRTEAARRALLDLDCPLETAAGTERAAAEAGLRRLTRARDLGLVRDPRLAEPTAWLQALVGDLEGAGKTLEEAMEGGTGSVGAWLLRGRLSVDGERLEEAASAFAVAARIAPRDLRPHSSLAWVLARRGDLGGAARAYERCLEIAPGSADLHYNAALARALGGATDRAVDGFAAVLELDPDHRAARENLAGALASAGRWREALEVFEEAARRAPEDATIPFLMARVAVAMGEADLAREHLTRALDLDPDLAPARVLLGNIEAAAEGRDDPLTENETRLE
jgi:tetratricopeptide (TPR) repeat protein